MCPKLGGVVASVSVLVFAAVLIGAVPASARHSSPGVRSSGSIARVRSRRSRCAPRGAITLKKTRRVLAYENDGYDFDTGYACSEVNGRRTRIYQVSSQIGSGGDVEAIKGDFVQYSWTSASGCRGDACPPSAAETFGSGIVNARTGKPLTVPSGAAAAAFTAAGSIAWVTGSPPTEQLSVRTAQGTRLVDSGDISYTSIKVTGDTLYWTNDGQQKSTPFR